MGKYLDKTGLERLVANVKSLVASAVSLINTTKSTIDNYTVNGHKISGNPTLTKSDVGLSNVENVAAIPKRYIGAANGVAPLDANSKIAAAYLPSYVDDVKQFSATVSNVSSGTNPGTVKYVVYDTTNKTFVGAIGDNYYAEWNNSEDGTGPSSSWGELSGNGIKPQADKIYVYEHENKTYRWSGTDLVEISASLALGETSGTAYAGDKGAALANDLATLKNESVASLKVGYLITSEDVTIALMNSENVSVASATIPFANESGGCGIISSYNYNKLTSCEVGATSDSAIDASEVDALFS